MTILDDPELQREWGLAFRQGKKVARQGPNYEEGGIDILFGKAYPWATPENNTGSLEYITTPAELWAAALDATGSEGVWKQIVDTMQEYGTGSEGDLKEMGISKREALEAVKFAIDNIDTPYCNNVEMVQNILNLSRPENAEEIVASGDEEALKNWFPPVP